MQVRGRLRGGTPAALKKLKEVLLAKGVPEESIQERLEEVREKLGDSKIKEAYTSFDPWSSIKAACQASGIRLIKQQELNAKKPVKPKGVTNEEDPLVAHDPWAAALQQKQTWKPDLGFFATQGGSQPALLEKAAHGKTGVAIVTEQEAAMLMQIAVGAQLQPAGPFTPTSIQFPGVCNDGTRILMKGQLINLGRKDIVLADAASKVLVAELDGVILACEIIKEDMSATEWSDVTEGTIRFLKKKIPPLENAIFANWAKKFFVNAKPTREAAEATSVFIMLRAKKEFLAATLKAACPGVYISPRTEDRTPVENCKVVWLSDRSLEEMRVLANSEPAAFGIVRSKSGYGIRVLASEYLKLRKKWIPGWIPEANTPYDLAVNQYFFLDNAPLSSGKAEIQCLLKELAWPAMAIRQTRPRQWLIGASQDPPKATILAEHGTMLISARPPKGKGKGKPQSSSSWLLAGASAKPPPLHLQGTFQMPGPMQVDAPATVAIGEVEDRLQRKMDEFCNQQKAAQHMLKKDLVELQADVKSRFAQQEAKNAELRTGFQKLENSVATAMTNQLQMLTSSIQQSQAELIKQLTQSQESFKAELTSEVRSQIAVLRKRTPSPPGSDAEKRAKQ